MQTNLQEIIILLTAAIFIVAIFKRLNLSPVVGYLVAGGIIGPHGLEIIKDVEETKYIAEFGVVFLLFAIGLELTFKRLKSMRRHVFGFGSAQFVITGVLIGWLAYMMGQTPKAALIIGGGLALSSTAMVMQILSDSGEQSTQTGRLSLATLILQDLAVVPLLILVPLLAQTDINLGEAIVSSLLESLLAIIIIYIIGRQFLKPLYQLIASLNSNELFVATTIMVVLGSAWTTHHFGLSMELGAFVAGLLIAETEFRHQVEADILPFKGLLMGLFFMTIGMSIDLNLFKDSLWAIAGITAALVIGKSAIVMLLAHFFGFKTGCSIKTGFLLSQGSEFAFILFGLAAVVGVLEQEISQMLLLAVSLSMALTPLLHIAAKELVRRLELRNPLRLKNDEVQQETIDLADHVIVAGFGRVGQTICKLLSERNINYVAIDDNPTNVHKGRKAGYPVYYGNAERIDLLKSLGIERATLVAVTVDSKKASRIAVKSIRTAYPLLPIVARAKDRVHARELLDLGANTALAEAFESSLILGNSILKNIGIPDQDIERVIEQFRADEYPSGE